MRGSEGLKETRLVLVKYSSALRTAPEGLGRSSYRHVTPHGVKPASLCVAINTSTLFRHVNPIQGALDGFLPADISHFPLVCAPTRFPLFVRLPVVAHLVNIAPESDS